jgi:hypothetical protein
MLRVLCVFGVGVLAADLCTVDPDGTCLLQLKGDGPHGPSEDDALAAGDEALRSAALVTENATDASDRDTGEGTVVTVPLMSEIQLDTKLSTVFLEED